MKLVVELNDRHIHEGHYTSRLKLTNSEEIDIYIMQGDLKSSGFLGIAINSDTTYNRKAERILSCEQDAICLTNGIVIEEKLAGLNDLKNISLSYRPSEDNGMLDITLVRIGKSDVVRRIPVKVKPDMCLDLFSNTKCELFVSTVRI